MVVGIFLYVKAIKMIEWKLITLIGCSEYIGGNSYSSNDFNNNISTNELNNIIDALYFSFSEESYCKKNGIVLLEGLDNGNKVNYSKQLADGLITSNIPLSKFSDREFFLISKNNVFNDWTRNVNSLFDCFDDLYLIRNEIFDAFNLIKCDPKDKFQENAIRDNINRYSPIQSMFEFVNAFLPIYKEELTKLENKKESLNVGLDKAKRAYEKKKSHEALKSEVYDLRQKISHRTNEIENAKKQMDHVMKFKEADDLLSLKLDELEKEEDFYIEHDEKEKRIIELNHENEDLDKQIKEYLTEKNSLNSVADSNIKHMDEIPLVSKERYEQLEKEYDQCLDNEKIFKAVKMKLVQVDEAAEQCEAAEGVYLQSLEDYESLKEDGSESELLEKKKQSEVDKACWDASKMLVDELRNECVDALRPFGVDSFNSVRTSLTKIIANNSKESEEKRREASEIAGNMNKREFASKGIYLRNIRVPQIDTQLDILESKKKQNLNEIDSLQKAYDSEIKGKEFISHQDLVKTLELQRSYIEEHKFVYSQNKRVVDDLSKEIETLKDGYKEKSKKLDNDFDVPDLPLINLKIEYSNFEITLGEMEERILTYKNFIQCCENFIEISSPYYSSYKNDDLLINTFEEIISKKDISLKNNDFKESIKTYFIRIAIADATKKIYNLTNKLFDIKFEDGRIDYFVDGKKIDMSDCDMDDIFKCSMTFKNSFIEVLVNDGILKINPLIACYVSNSSGIDITQLNEFVKNIKNVMLLSE